jgi:transposase
MARESKGKRQRAAKRRQRMSRQFIAVDYEEVLDAKIRLGDVLPANHLARFVVSMIGELDLQDIYAGYGEEGGAAYAPELLLGLLVYGYATGVFSSRKLERATYEMVPFIYIAGGKHPDHDTINTFRSRFLGEVKELFVQVLLMAQAMNILKLGNISLDGSKLHADASKSQAVSYGRLLALETRLRQEVTELFELAERAETPEGFDVPAEIELRQQHLAGLAEAKAVLEMRAAARHAQEMAEYEAKLKERAAKAERTGKQPPGSPPQAPTPGARDKDQYNFTDPDSRIMKNGNKGGFEQCYNGQVAVDQKTLLIVATTLSNHPNDQQEALPTVDAIAPALGVPAAIAMDAGYFSLTNVEGLCEREIDPYIATGREPHHVNWQRLLERLPDPPSPDAPLALQMAYKLRTEIGQRIYRMRKCTVEPVFGIIKEVIGFRQLSLRGLDKAAGEWSLVCLAFNFKRLHSIRTA